MKMHLILAVALGLSLAGLVLAETPVAQAATFTVNSQTDAVDANPGDGTCATAALPSEGVRCTLRAAIMEANALSGPDTINLPAGTYSTTIVGSGEDAGATGDQDVTSELTIVGADRNTTFIDGGRISGISQNNDRVLDVLAGANLTLTDVTVRNGFIYASGLGCGAGIRNAGVMTLQRSVVSQNYTFMYCYGGGISNGGTLSVVDSLVIYNSVGAAMGGGIVNAGTLTVTNSTITKNTASATYLHDSAAAGGLYNTGQATFINSTISENHAVRTGFGDQPSGNIANGGQLSLVNSTIFANTPANQAGINNGSGATVSLTNTIIANAGTGTNCGGAITSQGYNLDSGMSCGLSQPTDQSNKNARLGPLGDNGGPTPTHALLAGSPAIDAGTNAGCPPTDQRGLPRPRDGDGSGVAICDIGAYELQDPYPVDMAVQANYAPDPPDVGSLTDYVVTVHTVEGGLAPSAVLTATLPGGVTFVSAAASQGSCQGTGPVVCTLGNIPAGASAVVTIKLIPTSGGTITAGAQVSSALPDPNPANNSTSVSTTVHAVCAPRPNAALQATRVGPGTLQGMVTATRTALQPANALQSLQVTRLDNATITVNGAAVTAGQTLPLPAGTTSVQVVVTRVAPGPFMAYLTVADECGAWTTFLGGGAGVP